MNRRQFIACCISGYHPTKKTRWHDRGYVLLKEKYKGEELYKLSLKYINLINEPIGDPDVHTRFGVPYQKFTHEDLVRVWNFLERYYSGTCDNYEAWKDLRDEKINEANS